RPPRLERASRRAPAAHAAAPEPLSPTPEGPAGAPRSGGRALRCRSSPFSESPDFRTDESLEIFHRALQFVETARDAARDRACGQVELLADRAVALVAGEEPVEHVAARLADLLERLPDRERLVERLEHLVDAVRLELLDRRLTGRLADPVDAEPPCQLRGPRPERVCVPELRGALAGLREDALEDIPRPVQHTRA